MVRIVVGFLAAALWLPLLSLATSGPYGAFWFGMTAMFTVPLTLLVAVPLFYMWRRRITFWLCLVAGLAIGIIGAALFLLVTNPLAARNWAPLLIVAGVLSSVVFWATAVWRNSTLTNSRSKAAGDAAI